jgi:hypothetical protein
VHTRCFPYADPTYADGGIHNEVKMEILKLLDPVKMDASLRSQCLLGTRQEVLSFVTGWLTTPSEDKNVFWLYGLAGSGKSTISTTVAEYFRDLGRLGAFIFFDRNNPTNSDPSTVIRTLAHQLASFDSHIRSAVCTAIERDNSIASASIQRQSAKLLLDPLESITMEGPVVIVIDALDECGDATSRKSLLRLLADELGQLPRTFRFLITSREESDINAALAVQTNIVKKELVTTTDSNINDILLFLHHEMATIRKYHSTFGLAADWPGEATVLDLVRRSAGMFIWASLAANFISEGHSPDEQIELLQRDGYHGKADAALDSLYSTALRSAGKWDSEIFSSDFRVVMGAVLVGRIPLADTVIDQLFSLDGQRSSEFIFSRLRCLLLWRRGQPAQTLHASFADYLTNSDRSGSKPWFIDQSAANSAMALGCLRLMTTGLSFNICGLESSYLSNKDVPGLSQRIEAAIPPHKSYACRFWADHLQTATRSGTLKSNLEDFIYHSLLYWLEVLSLINCIPLASPALLKTARWNSVSRVLC